MTPLRTFIEKLSPKQRQFVMLATIGGALFGLLWLVLVLGAHDTGPRVPSNLNKSATPPTNIGVMAPGQQVNPLDQWVGTAGRKLSQYEQEREQQDKLNRDRRAFEEKTMQRFAELEQRLVSQGNAQPPVLSSAPAVSASVPPPLARQTSPVQFPPQGALTAAASLPPPPPPRSLPSSAGVPLNATTPAYGAEPPPPPALVRVNLSSPLAKGTPAGPSSSASEIKPPTLESYIPVSFTRGVLLGGLDAPTGGQSQSNPHPVLIRLSDNSVLPNRFRAEYRECFVIAAGYGDISSERAYLRTENLSCVRPDGTTLEVKIQGSVYGEDGKYGMRGRLVTKQGAMLANALLAGIVGGIGQGISSTNTTVSTSSFGTVATQSAEDAMRAGIGTGVGRALDRLAQYYIKLAEQTFPVIEIDAGREIDVVITKGVRIDAGPTARPTSARAASERPSAERFSKVSDDEGS